MNLQRATLLTAFLLYAPQSWALYMSLFNVEGESTLTAQYVTYSSLADMLTDSNRLGIFDPNSFGAGRNVVGSAATIVLLPPEEEPEEVPEPGSLGLTAFGLLAIRLLRPGRRTTFRSPPVR